MWFIPPDPARASVPDCPEGEGEEVSSAPATRAPPGYLFHRTQRLGWDAGQGKCAVAFNREIFVVGPVVNLDSQTSLALSASPQPLFPSKDLPTANDDRSSPLSSTFSHKMFPLLLRACTVDQREDPSPRFSPARQIGSPFFPPSFWFNACTY